ncbi:MAG: class I SAM-dependent methyltransferase [Verrucomicrobia bacterium]|nr:class I SAM-dependent methyltransferase [Verrucomicrobiota bacterium]
MKLWRLYKAFPWLEYRHRVIAGLPSNASLLEIGSSNCDRAKLFKVIRPDLKVFATDIKDFSREAGSDIVFFISDVTQGLPSELNGQFDCVTTMHLLEHLTTDSYDAVVAAIHCVLKPGGVWYIETPSTRSTWFPSFTLGLRKYHCPINFYDDPSHVKPFSKSGLFYLLVDRGFVVRRVGIARNLLFAMLSPVLILAGLLFRQRLWFGIGLGNLFGWSVFAHGTKPR